MRVSNYSGKLRHMYNRPGMSCLGAGSFFSRQEGASDSSELDKVVVPATLNYLSARRSRVH